MIELKVEPYCHNCPDFKPVTYPTHVVSDNNIVCVNTTISCQQRNICRDKYEYIKSQMEKTDEKPVQQDQESI